MPSNCSVCFHCGSSGISAFRRTGRVRNNFAYPVEEGLEENTEEGTDETDNEDDDADDQEKETGQTKRIEGTGGEDDYVLRMLAESAFPIPTEEDLIEGLAENKIDADTELSLTDSTSSVTASLVEDVSYATQQQYYADRSKLLTRDPTTYQRIFEGPFQATPEWDNIPFTGGNQQAKRRTQNPNLRAKFTTGRETDERFTAEEEFGEATGEPPIEAYGESPLTEDVDLTVDEPLAPYGTEEFEEVDVQELFDNPAEYSLVTDSSDENIAELEPETGTTGYETWIDINGWNEAFAEPAMYMEWDHTRDEKGKKKAKPAKKKTVSNQLTELSSEIASEAIEDMFDDIFRTPEELSTIRNETSQQFYRRIYEENYIAQNYGDNSVVDTGTGEITSLAPFTGHADRIRALEDLDAAMRMNETNPHSEDVYVPMSKAQRKREKAETDAFYARWRSSHVTPEVNMGDSASNYDFEVRPGEFETATRLDRASTLNKNGTINWQNAAKLAFWMFPEQLYLASIQDSNRPYYMDPDKPIDASSDFAITEFEGFTDWDMTSHIRDDDFVNPFEYDPVDELERSYTAQDIGSTFI